MLERRAPYFAACLAAVYLTTLGAPALAQPQPTGPDVVRLKDGNVLRGTLTEVAAGDHATLTLSNGQTATIKWEVIQGIEKAGQPVLGAPAAAAPASAASPAGRVQVHIDADRDVTMEQQSNGTWIAVCSAPCDRELSLDANYRITGGGMRSSHSFRLAANAGQRVFITVNGASKGGFVGGIVLIAVGAPVLLIGGLVLLVAAAVDSVDASSGTSSGTGGAKTVGWTMVGVGVAGIVVGIVLLAGNSSTKAEQSVDQPKPREAAWRGVDTAFLRMPTWREHVPAGVPAPTSIPFFSGSF